MSQTNANTHTGAAPATKWRMLLVDDEPVQRMLVGRMLTRAGFEVVTAEDGEQALKRMAEGDISLMITDWEMPKMDGLSLCRALRSMGLDHYVYAIVVTSRDAVEHVVMGLQAGADDYLVKPVLEPELLARLNTGKRLLEMERSLRIANEENLRLSITDALTGVFNRRYLMDQLGRELERAQRYQHPLSLMLCDVDHFKRINDTYGHQTGDEVLIGFAKSLRQSLRDTDWVARYGGEEFVVVLPETSVAQACVVADRCRAQLAEKPLQLAANAVQITASFGVSGWEPGMDTSMVLDKLIAAADAGVYASKSGGRNRVTVQSAAAA
ncbi:MAG: diguanylate cyclase [Steroidobacteraceae bacterium]